MLSLSVHENISEITVKNLQNTLNGFYITIVLDGGDEVVIFCRDARRDNIASQLKMAAIAVAAGEEAGSHVMQHKPTLAEFMRRL